MKPLFLVLMALVLVLSLNEFIITYYYFALLMFNTMLISF